MRISQAVNRTIFHLRHQLFGPGRFEPVQATRVSFSPKRVGSVNLHRPQHLRHDRALFNAPRHERADTFRPSPWPFDTGFPSGLPEVSLFAGQQLVDMPSTASKLAQVKQADNLLGTTNLPAKASGKPGTADHLGTIIDVFA